MIEPRLVEGLAFTGVNRTWEAVQLILDEAIAEELAVAISRETHGEDRTHAAGRAEALHDLKALLGQLRDEALIANGVMVHAKDG